MQDSQANCGPLALRNALAAIGVDRSTEECETLCKVSATNGTTNNNMVKGLHKLEECRPSVIQEIRPEIAFLRLDASLRAGRPVIICVDNWSHWISAIGRLGNARILVVDSANSELVLSYGWEQLLNRWGNQYAKRGFWGVSL